MSPSHYVQIDLLAQATNVNFFSTISATNGTEPVLSLLSYNSDFQKLLGPKAAGRKIHSLTWPAFHEGGVYNKKDNSIYVTGNRATGKISNVTAISLDNDKYPISTKTYKDLWVANGATSYYPPGADTSKTPPLQLYCDQGDDKHTSSLISVDVNTGKTKLVVTNFNGRNFTSPNDVRQHPKTGDIWFTDPSYGYVQGFRPKPDLPNQVYRYEPKTGAISVVADGFVEPNGFEFSPDLKTAYITDTGSAQAVGNPSLPATIYAYDVIDQKRLANRRVLAYSDRSIPDGIHTDTKGNVWVAQGDGLNVWNSEGVLLGKVFVGEGSNNFAFAPGKLFVFANNDLWVVENVDVIGREVSKDFGTRNH